MQPIISMHNSGDAVESSAVDLSKIRAYSACKSCRAKKIKCLPTLAISLSTSGSAIISPCQQCSQSGTECTYPPTRDRAAYSRQYVQSLEARVQALELLNMRILPMLESFERENRSPVKHASSIGITVGAQARSRRTSNLPIDKRPINDDLEADEEYDDRYEAMAQPRPTGEERGQMAQDEHGNYRWIGSSNTLSLLDSFGQRGGKGESSGSENHGGHTTIDPSQIPDPLQGNGTAHSNPYFGPVAGSGVVKALPGFEEVNYPSRDAAEMMVHAFFSDVHPCLPVVVEKEFREMFKGLMDRKANGRPEGVSPAFISVVFAVFALGERVITTSRAWERERGKQAQMVAHSSPSVLPGEAEAGVIWYERAQILHYTSLRDVNLHQVQCLSLLAAFQASVNAMPMSWLLAGQALRVAQDLGLHRSPFRMKVSRAEKEIRSRCWWAIYGLERLVSISLGRPVGIDDSEIDVAYPAALDDESLTAIVNDDDVLPEEPHHSTMSGFIALTKLCRIAGRVAHVFYRPSKGRSISDPSWAAAQQITIDKLDKLLRDWLKFEVPSKYKDPSSARSVQLVSAVLSNAYFAVMITLHRNFLPPNPDYPRPKPPPSSQSLARCVDAARSVIHIAAQSRILLPPSHHIAVYCQYLWTSAVILLLCEVQAKDQVVIDAVGSHVESCRQSLFALEPVWPGSRKLKELLNDVEGRTKDVLVAARPRRPSKKRKSSSHEASGAVKPDLNEAVPLHGQDGMATERSLIASQGKRSRTEQTRYETSDARSSSTNTAASEPVIMSRQSDPRPDPGGNVSYNTTPSGYPTTSTFDLAPTFDLHFDVGGVNFNGLEMLQGFTGVGAASHFWASLVSDPSETNLHAGPGARDGYGPQHFTLSGQGTPTSGQGVSPSSWQQPTSSSGQLNPALTGDIGEIAHTSEGIEFWSQVAGSSFDWQADPNVPFSF